MLYYMNGFPNLSSIMSTGLKNKNSKTNKMFVYRQRHVQTNASNAVVRNYSKDIMLLNLAYMCILPRSYIR